MLEKTGGRLYNTPGMATQREIFEAKDRDVLRGPRKVQAADSATSEPQKAQAAILTSNLSQADPSASTRSIDILIKEIPDAGLRSRLAGAVNALRKQTRFGLVFEGHHPEIARLSDAPVRRGSLVARRGEKLTSLYRVYDVKGANATCGPVRSDIAAKEEILRIPVADLVVTRRFGDAIYPSLRLVDSISRGLGKPWHVLLEADNYHALQTLLYTHEERVDCIYIDPPYNTGAKDWKYNNDYIDGTDPWKHSKWLSFMEKRLKLARRLLKPDGVLIVTVDEHEVHHLGCLLEQTLPEFYRQMVTIVNNPKGVAQGRFSRVEEHAIFCFRGGAVTKGVRDDLLTTSNGSKNSELPRWAGLIRSGTGAKRVDRKTMFYYVVVDPKRGAIVEVGPVLPYPEKPNMKLTVKGFPVAWPVRRDGSLGRWGVGREKLIELLGKGYVKLGKFDPKRGTWGISYLSRKPQKQIESGIILVTGFDKTKGVVQVEYAEARERQIKTVWYRSMHDAGTFGSDLLKNILGEGGKFPFPKSVYAERDAILSVVRDNREAIVLDFFAGSGTTLNAVNLINAADGGRRQCILVTNNEVSEDEAKRLGRAGYSEGDAKWDERGICRAVTWPRTKFTIAGKRDDGERLPGEYMTGQWTEQEIQRPVTHLPFAEGSELDAAGRKAVARLIEGVSIGAVSEKDPWHLEEEGKVSILWDVTKSTDWIDAVVENDEVESLYVVTRKKSVFLEVAEAVQEALPPLTVEREVKRPLAEGFEENLAYFQLGFLDLGDVARGQAFAAVLPLLWMVAGAKGECPKAGKPGKWLVSPECGFAVLHRESAFQDFLLEIDRVAGISTIFLVTDSQDSYNEMRAQLASGTQSHMLYSSYLRSFRINTTLT